MEQPTIIMKTHRCKKKLKDGSERIYTYERQEILRSGVRGVKPKPVTRTGIYLGIRDFTDEELTLVDKLVDKILTIKLAVDKPKIVSVPRIDPVLKSQHEIKMITPVPPP